MEKNRSRVAVVLIMVFFSLFCVVSASAASPKRVVFTLAVSENSTWFKGAQKFVELINSRTGGRYKVEIFASDQLAAGNIIKGLELLRMGGSDIDMRSILIYTTVDPKFTVPLMPWLVPSYEEADKAMNGLGGKMVSDLVRKNGIEPLAFGESGFRQITNNKRPIVTPDDLKNLKIRIPTNKMYISLFKAMKADPTSINFGELFAALQQGTVDGQENPPDVIASAKVEEVQKYMTEWNFSYDPIIMAASKKFWNSLPVADQKIFTQASLEAMEYQKKISREVNAQLTESFRNKMQITTLTQSQIEAFKKAAIPVYEEYAPIVGKDLLEAFGYGK